MKTTMKNLFSLSLLCCVAALLFGCTTTTHTETGNAYNFENISKIVKGKTTESEVIALLGTPYNRTTTSDGKVMLSYQYGSFTRSRTGFGGIGEKRTREGTTSTAFIELQNGVVVEVTASNGKI